MVRARTYKEHYGKYPEWFRTWQKRFYSSKQWRNLREQIMIDRRMISDHSGQLINGKAVLDHKIEITPDNYMDENITLNPENLQLLTFEEHNRKTFGSLKRDSVSDFNLEKRIDSLF